MSSKLRLKRLKYDISLDPFRWVLEDPDFARKKQRDTPVTKLILIFDVDQFFLKKTISMQS